MHNKTTIIEWLTPLYEAARILDGPPPHLCSFTDLVSLRSPGHTNLHHPILAYLTRMDLKHGILISKWDALADVTLKFLKENPQCKLASKPYQTSNFIDYSKPPTAPGTAPSSPSCPTPASESQN